MKEEEEYVALSSSSISPFYWDLTFQFPISRNSVDLAGITDAIQLDKSEPAQSGCPC